MRGYYGLLVMFIAVAAIAVAASSSSGEFTATSPILANLSNSYAPNISLFNITGKSAVSIYNATSSVMNSTFDRAPFQVFPSNSSVALPANVTISFLTSGLNPGRYNGTILVFNSTNVTENATVVATLDVPITLTGGSGTFSGSITNTTIEYYYFNMSNVVGAAGVNITIIERTNNENFTIWVYDNTTTFQPPQQQTAAGTSLLWNASGGHSYPLGGMWYVAVSNGQTNTSINFTATITVLQNSFRTNSSFVSGTAPINENIRYNKTVTYIFYVENNASYDIKLQNITSNGPYLNYSTSSYMEWSHNLANDTTVAAGSSIPVSISVTINTSKTNNQQGTYAGWLFLNTSNGYPWNTYNLSITATLSNSLAVTVVDVSNDTQDSNTTVPGTWINLTVAPKYQNNSLAVGMVGDNFTATLSHVYGISIGSCTINLLNETKVFDPGSAYLIKGYLPSTSTCGYNNATLGGNYSVSVSATDPTGWNTGSGTWAGNLTVDESALLLTAWDSSNSVDLTSLSKAVSATVVMTPKLYNYGPKTATGVFVNHTLSGACSLTSGGGNSIYLGSISGWTLAGVTNSSSSTWTFTMSPTPGTCTINLTGYATTGAWATWSRNVVITVSNSSSGGTTGGTTGSDQATGTNTSSSGASIDLSITSWPKHVSIIQGQSQTMDIMIRNSGTKKIESIIAKVDGVDASWVKGTELSSLAAGLNYTLPVTLTIPATATVKNYSIVYVASSVNATARASADLAVLPSEDTKKTINETLTNLTVQYDDMVKKLNELMAKGTNITTANATLNEVKTLIDKANGYAAAGDWFSANSLLTQIQSALNSAETKISAITGTSIIGGPGLGDATTYLMAGAGVILVAVGAIAVWMIKTGRKLPTFKIPLGKDGGKSPMAWAAPKSAAPRGGTEGPGALARIKEKLKRISFKRKGSPQHSYHYQSGQ